MKKWLLADLHIHSIFSDGSMPVEEIVKIYGEAGFDVIAITDHLFDTQSPRSPEIHEEGKSIKDVQAYFQKIEEVSQWAKQAFGLLVIPGLEICNLSEDYHILGIDLKEPINPNQDADGVIKEIHRQGGLAIASHPPLKLSYFLNEDKESILRHPLHLWNNREKYVSKIDAWEIANQGDLFDGVGLERLPFVANSDFHERHHLTSWKSMIFAEKEKEGIKRSILERKVAIFFYNIEKMEVKPHWRLKPPKMQPFQEDAMNTIEGMKIMIVDDERDLVDMVAYNLQKKGYIPLKAHDGFEAWEKLESLRPDLLILDLMMPNLDGWELCRLVRKHKLKAIRELPILILTARAMPEDRIHGFEMGGDDYLTKPFSITELMLRVEKLAEKRRAITQLEDESKKLQSLIEKREANIRQMAHDLKSPLISIGFSAKRMLHKYGDTETSSNLKTIFDNSCRLTRWIDESLRLHKIEPAPQFQEEMKEIDILPLFSRTIDLLKGIAMDKNIEVELKPSGEIPKMACHEDMLLRALVNLLSNALKFTPRHGRVEISVLAYLNKRARGVLEISFRDTGIGIYEDELDQIFQPHYRGENTLGIDGDGLGLVFVKEVVDLHGGKILVQSTPNRGSLFCILLPIRNVSEETIQNARQAAPSLSNPSS